MKNSVTTSLLEQVSKKSKLSKIELAFLSDYYHRLSGQDYTDQRSEFFLDAAKAHLDLAQKRTPKTHSIQIKTITNRQGQPGSLISIVTDDRPFIVDSLINTLVRLNKRIDRTNHPIFEVERTKKHKLTSLERRKSNKSTPEGSQISEAFIQFETEAISDLEQSEVIKELRAVLENIGFVTDDWEEMKKTVHSLGQMIDKTRKGPAFAEYQALLNWMADDHFAFIGYAEIEQTRKQNGSEQNKIDNQSLKGILRAFKKDGIDILSTLPPLVESQTAPFIFTKSRKRILIHRANYLDVILIDHDFDTTKKSKSNKRRVSCILGFLAGSTTTSAIASIPHLRSKAEYILETSTLRQRSYAYKSLRTILETLPRELIFQLSSKALYGLCMSLLNHQERRVTRVHIKHNVCGHFYSCLVYVPKDLFNTDLRKRIQSHLSARLGASEITFNVRFSESILTQIHFTVFVSNPPKKKINQDTLEKEIQVMAQDWEEQLAQSLQSKFSLSDANSVFCDWKQGISPSYRLDHDIETAVSDITLLEQLQLIDLGETNERGLITAKVELDREKKTSHLRLYSADRSMPLSDALPILDNMGLRVPGEQPYSLTNSDGQIYWINHFEIVDKSNQPVSAEIDKVIEEGFMAIWFGNCENDGFNQLMTITGLDWRQVNVIRCYFAYLKQIRLRYSDKHIIESLLKYPDIVTQIVMLFEAKFRPPGNHTRAQKIQSELTKLLPEIQTLDEERIFNALIDTLNATVRTNYFQTVQGEHKSTISLKLSPRSIPRIPEPAPLHEIFVYSPRMEGVHLRGGDVARGGLRWSERPDDYRTEVLGLVKAQQVKNAVIVPVGSKGGFVAKQLPFSDRDQIQKEVIACYRLFISGLLDITDNISGKKVIPAEQCVRLDGEDPYLVVAADKGTATFSDIANGISIDANFWLGDAFASGGSEGYDHKKMGITARGAWESVKRHFRELGKDIQSQEFTVAAIGDMAGDVFGNGMLLSEHIQLVAAFNHLHIFIDPTPNCKKSFSERKRLFGLPRSSWTDYNQKLISKGGGIFPRTAKSIDLSPQAMKALSTTRKQVTPDELINIILKSNQELLWNGGIGTYIKSSNETNEEAQDRNNDAVRVDSSELKVKVIGEGGNLGLTQKARIEFNKLGGYCYTDAIDNSAGVDTSDHEVNIKILLNQLVAKKKLSKTERNKLLSLMEKAVGEHVLLNNYTQTEILSIESCFAKQRMSGHVQAIQSLSASGLLNRKIEYLPEDTELIERAAQNSPLTRAELAVVMAYSKMELYDCILQSDISQAKHMKPVLLSYFPPRLVQKYETEVAKHPLGKEIISTVVTNDMVGTMGPAFHIRMQQSTGAAKENVVRAYLVAKDAIESESLINDVRSFDNRLPALTQQKFLLEISGAIESCVLWLLDMETQKLDVTAVLKRYNKVLKDYRKQLLDFSENQIPAEFAKLTNQLPDDSKRAVKSSLESVWALAWTFDIIDIALKNKTAVSKVMQSYFIVQDKLELISIKQQIHALPAEDQWRQQARSALSSSLRKSHAEITNTALRAASKKSVEKTIETWLSNNDSGIQSLNKILLAMKSDPEPDFAMLTVVVNELSKFTQKN